MKQLLLIAGLIFSVCVSGQTGNIAENEGITGPLHQANTGRIRFMGSMIPAEEVKESDYLSSFELNENTDFNIRAYLDNSLTNYLHLLSPSLTVEELTKNGNYRFSFFVDNTLVYTENLHPGAGTAENKNKRTVFRVPLISTTNEDSWGRFLWNRFMFKGGDDALSPGPHRLKIEIRPYLKTPGIKVGELIATGEITLAIKKPVLSEKEKAVQEILPNSGWAISNAQYDHDKIKELNEKIGWRLFKDITSIIVIKDGKLLLEEYFNGAGRDSLHDTRSVGKTFASALTGIAIKDKYIKNEDQSLNEFYGLEKYSNYTPAKDKVTLKSLLTMSSGFNGSDDNEESPGNEEKMYPTADWVKFALDLPMDSTKQPGKNWDYFTAGVVLLGDILHRSVPGGLEKYADHKLFKPLGIKNYKWQYTPQKVANTAGGLQMRSLDYAKFGQLYKNKGFWNGKELIPQQWVSKSLSRQLQLPGNEGQFYGYLFWNMSFTLHDRNYEAFYLSGNGGNKVFIFKDIALVIVITAKAYNKFYGHAQVNKMMERYILPAVIE